MNPLGQLAQLVTRGGQLGARVGERGRIGSEAFGLVQHDAICADRSFPYCVLEPAALPIGGLHDAPARRIDLGHLARDLALQPEVRHRDPHRGLHRVDHRRFIEHARLVHDCLRPVHQRRGRS